MGLGVGVGGGGEDIEVTIFGSTSPALRASSPNVGEDNNEGDQKNSVGA